MRRMNAKFRLLSALAVCLLAPGLRAEVRETLDTAHYEAQAQPGRSLVLALNDASPFRPGNVVYHSATAWYLDWKLQPMPTTDGRCQAGEVRIELHGQMILPRLLGGTAAQQQKFDAYVEHLREHELGHYEIGREAARDLEHVLYTLAPARSCAELQSAARDAGARLLPKYEAMGDAYDAQTQHGKTQGAFLVD
jgi:predicted secreted Zn-dependent protease